MKYRDTAIALIGSVVAAALLASCSNGEASSPPATQTTETETAATTRPRPRRASARNTRRFVSGLGTASSSRAGSGGKETSPLSSPTASGRGQDGWVCSPAALARAGVHGPQLQFPGVLRQRGAAPNRRMELGEQLARCDRRGCPFGGARREEVFMIGASMGGLAVLRAARTPGVDVAGVVSLQPPSSRRSTTRWRARSERRHARTAEADRRTEALHRRQGRRPISPAWHHCGRGSRASGSPRTRGGCSRPPSSRSSSRWLTPRPTAPSSSRYAPRTHRQGNQGADLRFPGREQLRFEALS